MSAELFLIVPPDLPADRVLAALGPALTANPPSALLLQRGELAENAYKALVKAVAPVAQKAGAAVLIEGEPGLVRMLGVDGLHVSGGIKAVREAVSALKPNMIVGVGDIGTRHDAMQKAELDIDYILFGPLSGAISEPERELAQWWAETMEIPSVLSDPSGTIERHDAGGSEFIGLVLAGPETLA
jgi:thiamine-phosphate pyrophosphorylase